MKRINLILTGLVIVFAVIIGFALIHKLVETKALSLYNIDQVDSGLSGGEISDLEGFIWQSLKDSEGFDDNKTDIIALIRPSSFIKTQNGDISNYEFLVDIDEFKTTYQVNFALRKGQGFYESPDIGCPVKELRKYPDNCCKGRHVMEIETAEACDE